MGINSSFLSTQLHTKETRLIMNLGKCWQCNRSVYQNEGFTFGKPTDKQVTHKGCFKCAEPGCTWQLNSGTYKSYEGTPYCAHHFPKPKPLSDKGLYPIKMCVYLII